MSFDDYQQKAVSFAVDYNHPLEHRLLGLVGEAGEIAEKFKKIYRDKDGKYSSADVSEIKKELGDTLWYIAALADLLGLSLSGVAESNIEKLSDRKQRDALSGSGDNR